MAGAIADAVTLVPPTTLKHVQKSRRYCILMFWLVHTMTFYIDFIQTMNRQQINIGLFQQYLFLALVRTGYTDVSKFLK